MTRRTLTVTTVNHLAMPMMVSPDIVWREIIRTFADTGALAEQGFTIEPLNDPGAVLGGYRMWKSEGAVIDDRITHITERDEAARRLSLFADFRSHADGLLVHACYQARETDAGTCYTIDCHTRVGIESPGGGSRAEIAAVVDTLTAQFDAHLTGYLATLRGKLEQADTSKTERIDA